MKKHLYIFFLLVLNTVFSQNKNLSIQQIDSISEVNGNYGTSDGIIEVKNKKKKVIGKGGFSISTYLNYSDDVYFNSLSIPKKKEYNREKKAELIKSTYNQSILYNNKSFQNVTSEFYYQNEELIFVKLTVTQQNKDQKEENQQFSLSKIEISESKPIKNTLLFDVQSWVRIKNLEIFEFYNKK